MSPFQPLFEKSRAENKGITLYLHGQAIGLVVTRIGDGWIAGKNRELSEIIVQLDRIDAVGIA